MSDSIKQQELIKRIANETGLTQKDVALVLKAFYGTVTESVLEHKPVLTGLGTFSTKLRKGRMARNPKTLEPKYAAPRYVIHYSPARPIKEQIKQSATAPNNNHDDHHAWFISIAFTNSGKHALWAEGSGQVSWHDSIGKATATRDRKMLRIPSKIFYALSVVEGDIKKLIEEDPDFSRTFRSVMEQIKMTGQRKAQRKSQMCIKSLQPV